MNTTNFRKLLKERIMEAFAGEPWVRGIWQGGSAATGFLDDLSDLDIVFVVEDHKTEETFAIFEKLLGDHYGVKSSLRIPEPAWHGHSQAFYFPKECPPLFYVDMLVEKLSAGNRLLEPDRHGKADIWLNRNEVLKPEPTPEDELLQANRRTFQSVKATMEIVLAENRKQILRGNEIDAMLEYQGFIQRRLAALLNLRYRPAKHDFGIRYADREYPPDVAERIRSLIYPGSIAGIGPRFEEAAAWAGELMKELEEKLGS